MRQHPHLYYCYRSGFQRGLSRSRFTDLQSHLHPSLSLCIRRELYEQGSDTGRHLHENFYALYIVQEGKGVHVINQQPYGIARGDVYVLSPGAVHAYRDYHSLIIDAFYFQLQLFFHEELQALRGLSGFWNLLITLGTTPLNDNDEDTSLQEKKLDHRLHLSPEQHRELEAMITEVCAEFVARTAEANLLTRSQFFRMLVHLARWQAIHDRQINRKLEPGASEEPAETRDTPEISATHELGERSKIDIAMIVHFCDQHFHEPLSVPQLAALMFLSPSRFSELFSRQVGMSPASYIRHLRLERAQMLLRTTTLSTTTIAHQIGMGDSAQLSRAFRAAFQLTPSAYRTMFRS